MHRSLWETRNWTDPLAGIRIPEDWSPSAADVQIALDRQAARVERYRLRRLPDLNRRVD